MSSVFPNFPYSLCQKLRVSVFSFAFQSPFRFSCSSSLGKNLQAFYSSSYFLIQFLRSSALRQSLDSTLSIQSFVYYIHFRNLIFLLFFCYHCYIDISFFFFQKVFRIFAYILISGRRLGALVPGGYEFQVRRSQFVMSHTPIVIHYSNSNHQMT